MKTAVRRVYEWELFDGEVNVAWLRKLREQYCRNHWHDHEEKPMVLLPPEQYINLMRDSEAAGYMRHTPDHFIIEECVGFKIKEVAR